MLKPFEVIVVVPPADKDDLNDRSKYRFVSVDNPVMLAKDEQQCTRIVLTKIGKDLVGEEVDRVQVYVRPFV